MVIGGKTATLIGRPILKAPPTQQNSNIVFGAKPTGAIPTKPKARMIAEGIVTELMLIIDLLMEVSITAFFAQILETPTVFAHSLSDATSIPFSISAYLIQRVLQKLAHPPAVAPTNVLRSNNFFPVAVLVTLAVAFLNTEATVIEEPMAAQ